MDEHKETLRRKAQRDAENFIRGAMGEPPRPFGDSRTGKYGQRTHEAITILMKRAGLTHAQAHKEYREIAEEKTVEEAEIRFKALTAKDAEMKHRSEFVRGAFFGMFEVEYEGKAVGWNHKLKSPHAEHKGFGFTPKEKFDGDMSSEWVSFSLRETQQHLIERFMDKEFVWTFYTPGREKGGMPRWNPKIKLRLKAGKLK